MASSAGSETVQELQMLEQQRQQLLMQKQTFQVEQNQVQNALNEVKATSDSVFKVISGALIKVEKQKMLSELEDKLKTLSMRIDSIEKQEKSIDDRMDSLQKELRNIIAKEKK